MGLSLASSARAPTKFTGEVMCRGDNPGELCWNCTAQASAKILQLCPNSKTASDVSLQGAVDVSDKACQSDPENAPSPSNFDKTLSDLINHLASNVSQGSSGGHMFATGTASISKSQRNTYAFFQCNRDISADQCGWCLQNAASDIAGCSKRKQGALIFEGSCRLSYGLQNFLLSQPMIVLPEKQKYKIEADDNHGNATEKDADYDLPQITLRAIGGK
ncbi:Cysteine-rich repeat secretory protein 38 [Nymphaea thermarum]|nr:Cysteine-rich repeat secretory protein 38 [Nymphaea thermarum]